MPLERPWAAGRLRYLLALSAALFALGAIPAAPALAGGLTISPAPNTPDASPQTQISVLGAAPDRIKSVTATGDQTGLHTGTLEPYSGDRGASFVPDQPFAQDETVSVVVRVRGFDPVRFSFTIAHLGTIQPPLNLTQTQPSKLDHFVSRPDLTPPLISVGKSLPSVSDDGDIMLTPLPSPVVHPESNNAVTINPVGPGGPMIIDGEGKLIWFQQLTPPDVAANLRIQHFGRKRVLTWWQGTVTPSAFGQGEGVIADDSYRTLRTVHAGNGYSMDIHEFTLTASGDALFPIYSPVLVHLDGTPDGTLSPLLDAIVQEVDVRTGLVVWEWHCYGHIPLEESYATPTNSSSYDAFHINSIQDLSNDRVLVSARDTSAIYDIDRPSGEIVWTLGGKASDFKMGPGASFFLQHDAQMLPSGRISLFDDEAGPPQMAPSSRGLILRLIDQPRRAKLVHEYHRATDTSAQSEGSLQKLGDDTVFVGWGAEPFFSQFSQRGRLLFDASLPQDDGSYRAYRFPWSAAPRTRPDVAAVRSDASSVSVYASWNGATEVARWQVLAGEDEASLARVATAGSTGFETRIDVSSSATTFAVRALDSSGRVLATSPAVPAA